jgi:hypothetical protein
LFRFCNDNNDNNLEDTKITDAQGRQAGDIGRYDFLQGDAVEPSCYKRTELLDAQAGDCASND